jgi:pimeloyl-ACP methyl ester carboxylesterase
MKPALFTLFSIACLLMPVRSHLAQTPNQLDGDWVGQFRINGTSVYVRTRFETRGATTSATFDMPLERPRRVTLRQIRSDSSGVHFELPSESASHFFDGRLTSGSLVGEVRQGEARGTFQLVRLAPVNLELYQRYAGSYQFGEKFIDVAPFSENENRLRFFDAGTRRTGVLYAVSDTEFFAGPSTGVAFPKEIVATFVRNERGEATGLTWRERGSSATGRKLDAYVQEEVTFQNGDVSLRGTLSIPATKGPHPAIVLIPGSGPARRPGGFWIPFFARHGIAVLVFDKRGAGASTGDWMKSTYDDLAADALAAVELLKKHKNIDAKQIGLWGNSEGGWVAPLAASRAPDIAFLLVRSGSGLPVWQTVMHEAEGQLRDGNDLTDDEIRDALALKQSVERIALDTKNWDDAWVDIDAAYQQARNKRWFNFVAVNQKDHWFWQWWRLRGGYDPASALEKVRCPVLVLLGEVDRAIPSRESAAAFERAFRASGNRDYTIRILPKANHGLLLGETGLGSESPRLREYSPGYMDGMADWLLTRVTVRK